MRISHDFIATKSCPSYDFLVVFGQVRVWDRKSAGRAGMVCGVGAGRDRTKNFNPCRTLVHISVNTKLCRPGPNTKGILSMLLILINH